MQNFGTASVSITIPYTLAKNESAGNVCGVFVDANGNVQWLTDSVYDSVEKVLRFNTNHFSTYGVGYKATNTTFTDTANHWAKNDIDFVVSRGLFAGTSATTFSPNTAVTRGRFVTVLGKLADIDSAKFQNTKFTDVKADAYYAPYVTWATEKNITTGTTATTFAPEQTITRQEMAVFMANYAKVMNYKVSKTREAITFADNANIASWASEAVTSMQQAGVIMGKDGNRFDLSDTATRAETSAILRRYIELIIDTQTAQG